MQWSAKRWGWARPLYHIFLIFLRNRYIFFFIKTGIIILVKCTTILQFIKQFIKDKKCQNNKNIVLDDKKAITVSCSLSMWETQECSKANPVTSNWVLFNSVGPLQCCVMAPPNHQSLRRKILIVHSFRCMTCGQPRSSSGYNGTPKGDAQSTTKANSISDTTSH